MCADTEGKESLDEVVKRKTNSLVSLFKKSSRPNIHSHKTPENITTSFARCRPLNGKNTRVLQHSDQHLNKCLHCAHVLCLWCCIVKEMSSFNNSTQLLALVC